MDMSKAIADKSVVVIQYTLTDQCGEVLETTLGDKALEFLYGAGALLPSLEAELIGLRQGDRKVVVLDTDQAYGHRTKDKLVRFRSEDIDSEEIKVGMRVLRLCTNGSTCSYKVTGTLGDWVYGDANHHLAGKTLRYDVLILDVR